MQYFGIILLINDIENQVEGLALLVTIDKN